ncbi:D-amino-acid transaminase [Peribacillus deserti]|uniref:D-alanine aminotransferase n=1 Tax=Peribacillus deserti TaxID=673318 RepID=A0A2N5M8D9_9BACI|nr:D-amino-acid transaminase [Peribacillus deserti]PLT30605.1 D-amino-acid transaminase [Peribacillus deserti]
MKVLVNNELQEREEVRVDIEDRGYQFGDGVYEVIRVYEGVPYTLDEHLARFYRSSQEIGITPNMNIEELKLKLLSLIEENELQDGGIYVQLSRGVAPRKHQYDVHIKPQLIAYPVPSKRPVKEQNEGVEAITADDLRWLRCDIKSLNLLYNIMIKQKAQEAGAFEGILVRDGNVTEGTSSNIFIIKDGTIYTHPAGNLILNGITRTKLLELFTSKGWAFKELAFSKETLLQADEVFMSSTTAEVVSITSIDGNPVGNGAPGTFTSDIREAFQESIESSIVPAF